MLRQDRLYTHTEGVFVQRSALRKQATLHFEGFKDSLRPLATQKNFLIRNQYVNIFQMRPWSSLSVPFDFWLYLWAEIWIPNSAEWRALQWSRAEIGLSLSAKQLPGWVFHLSLIMRLSLCFREILTRNFHHSLWCRKCVQWHCVFSLKINWVFLIILSSFIRSEQIPPKYVRDFTPYYEIH